MELDSEIYGTQEEDTSELMLAADLFDLEEDDEDTTGFYAEASDEQQPAQLAPPVQLVDREDEHRGARASDNLHPNKHREDRPHDANAEPRSSTRDNNRPRAHKVDRRCTRRDDQSREHTEELPPSLRCDDDQPHGQSQNESHGRDKDDVHAHSERRAGKQKAAESQTRSAADLFDDEDDLVARRGTTATHCDDDDDDAEERPDEYFDDDAEEMAKLRRLFDE